VRALVIGATGLTGRRVVRRLADGPHTPRAMIRDEAQAARFEEAGVDWTLGDLDATVDHAVEDCDAVVFCAGSGSGTGLDRTIAVDRDGAVRSMVAAEDRGVERYVMLSSMHADPRTEGEGMAVYYRAKGVADLWLARSGMVHTIVRPGRLRKAEGDGRVEVAPSLERSGSIARGDVARVLVRCLDEPATEGRAFDLLEGETPVAEALEAL